LASQDLGNFREGFRKFAQQSPTTGMSSTGMSSIHFNSVLVVTTATAYQPCFLSEYLHRAAEGCAQIPKVMPRVASGLAGSNFAKKRFCASPKVFVFQQKVKHIKNNCCELHIS
jgi:hypothetical protein